MSPTFKSTKECQTPKIVEPVYNGNGCVAGVMRVIR